MGYWVGGWAKWVMDIKEDTCWEEHGVLYVSDESLNSIPDPHPQKLSILLMICRINTKKKVKTCTHSKLIKEYIDNYSTNSKEA